MGSLLHVVLATLVCLPAGIHADRKKGGGSPCDCHANPSSGGSGAVDPRCVGEFGGAWLYRVVATENDADGARPVALQSATFCRGFFARLCVAAKRWSGISH